MNDKQVVILGWILFVISAFGFIIASWGDFWAMFGSVFFLLACFVFLVPLLRDR